MRPSTASAGSGHPYIPNSAPAVKADLLAASGLHSVEDVFAEIPRALRLDRPLRLPPAIESEWELQRHLEQVLGRNESTSDLLSFLGAGCYPHHVPAVCSEINSRAEFLTAYAGEPYEDHGKWQALFEYTSLMAELLDLDVVNVPTYDGYQAAATALRMAGGITGRSSVLLASSVSPAKRAKIVDYLAGSMTVRTLPFDGTGMVDRSALADLLGPDVAAVYLESPNAFGVVEAAGRRIADLARAAGSMVVVGTEPACLGYLEPPARWGADLVCGDIQSLGLGMHFGGANGGFIAARDTERIVMHYPSRLFGLAPTAVPGELGFCDIAYERTSLANRELGNEWVGTAAALWGITAGVYLALMGPAGMRELGQTVAARTRYAISRLSAVPGLRLPFAGSAHWREFLVRLDGDLDVAAVNERLLDRGILGMVDVTGHWDLGGPAGLICVTEKHDQADIDRLVTELEGILA